MGRGATNKRKGSNAERHYAKVFRELGYEHCETSRFASKKHDNAKIDLVFVPFNIQIKAGIQKNMNAGKELFLMETCIKSMFPSTHEVNDFPCLLFHYKQGTSGKKREDTDELVYMSLIQFDLLNNQTKDKKLEYLGQKSFKFDLNSDFKHVVWITFEYFKENILKPLYNGTNS